MFLKHLTTFNYASLQTSWNLSLMASLSGRTTTITTILGNNENFSLNTSNAKPINLVINGSNWWDQVNV